MINSEKIRTLAENMQSSIDNALADRQTNTQKRLGQAMSARLEGARLQRTQQVLFVIADLNDGDLLPDVITKVSKKSVYDLMGEKLEQVPNGYHSYYVGTGEQRSDDPMATLFWSFLTGKTEEEKEAEELQRLIEGLQFSKIAGYFPTPKAVIDQMIEHALIDPDHTVLEPSLGSGSIADAVSEIGAKVEGYEINHTLAEICQRKGYLLKRADFMTEVNEPNPLNDYKEYDRILMNPPFENLQDVDHVMKAFKYLKRGGIMVAIMSPSGFFNTQKKAQAFRNWFKRIGGVKYDLDQGSFKESGTGVNTVMVVLDRMS